MPATYTLIASNTLSSSAASVTFSSIPATYTDLVIRCSTRSDWTGFINMLTLRFNGSTASQYTTVRLSSGGGTPFSDYFSSSADMSLGADNGSTSTTSTFSSTEIYIPSYNATQNKPVSGIGMQENNNATNARIYATASLSNNTAAVTSIAISANTYNFESGSSFFLYGIKNS